MQDPNRVNRPHDPTMANRPVEDRGPTVVNTTRGSSTGGWAAAVILAVLVAVGIFYYAGTPGDGVDPNANTSAIETPDAAPADGQSTTGTQPLEAQPGDSQPAEGGTAQ
ncbi:hypothetical protein LXM94_19545 [Rhizobium sp. TRM95111]|uniref:hypothetical protein n=1 Tax=Rhizobium alarense TaxID=2846851 RepID=UPI001F3B5091|nr:hypothetical protein [Rhizobium alarense]MCF3642166.1 hypothetical protein [Rhizobium alarense]